MLAQDKPQIQAPQVWDKLTHCAQIGDYFHVPFTPVMQVVDRDTLEDGQVWLLLKPSTGSYTEEWLLKPEQPVGTQQQPEQEPQPVGFAGDSVAYQLQPTEEAQTEFSQGRCHGQQDAVAKLHPMYTQPQSEYAAGYVSGYNSELSPSSQEEAIEPPRWSVQYDPNWDWYRVWVGDSCIGHGSSYQQAERIAQKYIAAKEFWQQHRQAVIDAYAGAGTHHQHCIDWKLLLEGTSSRYFGSLMKKTANLFCEYLQRVKPDTLQSALDKFGGTRSRDGDKITYSFPDGSYAVMQRDKPGSIAVFPD